MSTVMLVFSVSPILAPLIGSAVIVPFGWRAVFVAVTIVAILGFALVAFALPETLPAGDGSAASSVGSVLSGFGTLFRDPALPRPHLHRRPRPLELLRLPRELVLRLYRPLRPDPDRVQPRLLGQCVGFIGASQFAARLARRYGFSRVIMRAVSAYAVVRRSSSSLLTSAGVDGLPVLMVGLFLAFACLGLVIPSTMVLALEEHGPIAGMASALGGTLQFLTGAVMISVASVFFDGTSLPMVAIIAACAMGAFIARAC